MKLPLGEYQAMGLMFGKKMSQLLSIRFGQPYTFCDGLRMIVKGF